MSREIKFRQPLFVGSVFSAWHYWGHIKGGFISPCAADRQIESQQYTGLEDKKGNSIYEGDIVYVAGSGNCEVEWDEDFAGWVFNNGSGGEDYQGVLVDLELIIGNIHENPELLL